MDGLVDDRARGAPVGRSTFGAGPGAPTTIVGVCGGSGSGKTTLATRLVSALDPGSAVHLSFDAYYRDLAHLPLADRAEMNFDHPDSLDADLLVEHLGSLRAGREVAVPVYDFAASARTGDLDIVEPHRWIVVEGVLLFSFPEVRDQLDLTVFRRCDETTRAARRLRRDVAERGRSPESVQHQWATTVQPMYERHVEPNAHHADLITTQDDDLDDVVRRLVARLTDAANAPAPAQPA